MQLRLRFLPLTILLALSWLWWRLFDQLHVEWLVNPEYSYGWIVPLLCACLAWRRVDDGNAQLPTRENEKLKTSSFSTFQLFSLVLLALAWLPTRLIEEANPEWRLVSWALALEVIGITLILLPCIVQAVAQVIAASRSGSQPFALPSFRVSPFVFPLCFFLVAVPWPTVIEASLIQILTRGNTAVAVELLNLMGVAALQHGNVIEVGSGSVGVEEACSGIRSLQGSLMLALFFGEFFRFPTLLRVGLCFLGFSIAFLFNVARTTLLAWVAARQGPSAIAAWHDPAGTTILVACFASLGALAWLWARNRERAETLKRQNPGNGENAPEKPPVGEAEKAVAEPVAAAGLAGFDAVVLPLVAWLVVAELGTELWYRWHERHLPSPVTWTVKLPRQTVGFEEHALPERARQLLRCDQSLNAMWSDAQGRRWQAIFLSWNPGRIAVHLAKNHTPEICLAGAGKALAERSDLRHVNVQGLQLPFRLYSLQDDQGCLSVLFCLWEDRAETQTFHTTTLGYASRLRPVLEGRRNCGQRSLELAVRGIDDPAQAEAALLEQLAKLVCPRP